MNYRDNLKEFTNKEIVLKSSLMPVKQGVPQGSIVRPILFVVFINDLPLHVTNPDVDIYADDSTLPFSSKWHANNSAVARGGAGGGLAPPVFSPKKQTCINC